MKTNDVLIDYENVQPPTLAVLNQEPFKILVFLGAHQTKISVDIAAALQHMGPRAEYIKMSGTGTNALDVHIAFYLGQLAAQEPDAYVHIISKDTGFDPLIHHLKRKHILACRTHDVLNIPVVKVIQATTVAENVAVIRTHLAQRGTAKPRTVKTLASTIHALFHKQLPDADVLALIDAVHADGIITITDTNVSYTRPA